MKKKNEIISLKNFIIIGSTARNAGKTEFACKIISGNSKKTKIIAIKVKRICINKENCDNLCKHCRVGELPEPGYVIIEEKNISGKKDTSRMLNAGASKVFFLQCRKDKLKEGFLHLFKKIPKNTVVVCESNGIREFLKPGLYVVIKNMHVDNIKESCAQTMHLADKIIEFRDMQWNFQPDRIVHKNNTWMLKE